MKTFALIVALWGHGYAVDHALTAEDCGALRDRLVAGLSTPEGGLIRLPGNAVQCVAEEK